MINLKKIEKLDSSRIVLREFQDKDAQNLFDNYGSDVENTKYMLWKNYKSIEDAKASIDFYKTSYEENSTFRQYAIALKDTDEVIGQISFEINKRHHFADIAYILGRKFQNNGYMTEAINTLSTYLFNELNCMRIFAEVMEDNIASVKLLKKCNFIEEGIEHNKYLNKQKKFTNVILFAKLNDNFDYGIFKNKN